MGHYSKNIPKQTAEKLVVEKNHPVFSKFANQKIKFWMSKYDPDFLHFGINSKEGEIKFNPRGRHFHKSYKDWNF